MGRFSFEFVGGIVELKILNDDIHHQLGGQNTNRKLRIHRYMLHNLRNQVHDFHERSCC